MRSAADCASEPPHCSTAMKPLRLAVDTNVLLDCGLFLTSDEHLRGIDHEHLTLVLNPFELVPPVIANPREIVRKFLHHGHPRTAGGGLEGTPLKRCVNERVL